MKVLFDKKWTLYSLLALALMLSLGILHLGYLEDDKAAAVKAIHTFHARLDSDNLAEVYGSATPDFHRAQSREEFTGVITQVFNKAGAFQRVKSLELTVIVDSPVPLVRAICNSVFEKASVTEFFTFVRSGHNLKLQNYRAVIGWFEVHESEIKAAKTAAAIFYEQLRNGDVPGVWNASDSDLRHAMTEAQFASLITDVEKRFGKCSPPGLIDLDYVENLEGQFVGLSYVRHCERGDLNEKLALRVLSGKAFLRGYRSN